MEKHPLIPYLTTSKKVQCLRHIIQGGKIIHGHLIGLVDEAGIIDMRYHQMNSEGKLMTGKCNSRPEILTHGKIRLHEEWQWTSGDLSSGQSIVEEV